MSNVSTLYNKINAITSRYILWLVASTIIGFSFNAHAHAPRENYVWVNVEEDHIVGRFEISITDLNRFLGVDIDSASEDRLTGVQMTATVVQEYLLQHFSLKDDQSNLVLEFQEASVFTENTLFAQYPFRAKLPASDILTVTNSIFLTKDLPQFDRLHKSLLVIEHNKQAGKDFGTENVALVFSPRKTVQEIDLANPSSILQWKDFLWQGVLHIWLGLDHLLFVALLLLISVVRSRDNSWEPLPGFVSAFWRTLKIVTIFTIAHTITLTLATLEIVDLNTTVVETIIALSIIAVAIMNVLPRYSTHSWLLIFAFGLFHGLGFASVLGDLQFRNVLLERILIMFNVGVELGQLAVVVVVFPLLYFMRTSRYYTRLVIYPISGLAAAVALYWVAERSGMVFT